MEKIVKYKAWDGEMFDTEDECIMYELKLGKGLYMFDSDAQRTNDVRNATIVYIPKKATNGHLAFYKLSQEHNMLSTGIADSEEDAHDKDAWVADALYVWDEWDETYKIVDSDFMDLVVKAIALRKNITEKEGA